jgi:hypothetical protein
VPNICVEDVDDPALEVPLDGAVVAVEDDEGRLLLHAEATVTAATSPTNTTNERLLCFTDSPSG